MVRTYNEQHIDIVTIVQQMEPEVIKATLKVYDRGTMWSKAPVASRILTFNSDKPAAYNADNSLPLILVTLFTGGLPEIQQWLKEGAVGKADTDAITGFLGKSLLQAQRGTV